MARWGSKAALADDHSLVTWDDAAAELCVKRRTVNRYAQRGRLLKHSSGRGVTRDSLEHFLAEQPKLTWTLRKARQLAVYFDLVGREAEIVSIISDRRGRQLTLSNAPTTAETRGK